MQLTNFSTMGYLTESDYVHYLNKSLLMCALPNQVHYISLSIEEHPRYENRYYKRQHWQNILRAGGGSYRPPQKRKKKFTDVLNNITIKHPYICISSIVKSDKEPMWLCLVPYTLAIKPNAIFLPIDVCMPIRDLTMPKIKRCEESCLCIE